jgi:probable rRNA maturation factor
MPMIRIKSQSVPAQDRSVLGPKPTRLTIHLRVEDRRWRRNAATLKLIRQATRLALKSAYMPKGTLTILLSDDAALKSLNHRFRGKPRATNVLSFTSSDPTYLGDIAIGYGIVAREAHAQGKRIKVHAAHLAIHGVLHLAGFDHQDETEALEMEALEVQILGRLGFPNPYSGKPYTGKGKAA